MLVDDPTVQGLDPRLGALGELLGILARTATGADLYTLRTAWFRDPITPIKEIVTERRRELLDLIFSFLGDAEASPMAGSGSQTWRRIEYPNGDGEAAPTGVYLVTDSETSSIALGAEYKYSESAFSATLRLQLPLVDLASGKFGLESDQLESDQLDSDQEAITLALQLRAGSGAFKTPAVSLAGLDLTAKLRLSGDPEIDLLLREFSLGGGDPRDLSLAELAKDPSQLVGEGLRALVKKALSLATEAAVEAKADPIKARAMESDVLWTLGLSDKSHEIPSVDWGKLAGAGFGAEWSRWFDSIAAKPETLKAWLHGPYCLMRGLDVTARTGDRDKDLGGSGTEADPFAVSIFSGDGKPRFDVTVAVDTSNGVRLRPGLRAGSPAIRPSDDIDIRIEAEASLSLKPAFTLSATVEQNKGAELFSFTNENPDDAISPNRFAAGIRFESEQAKLSPFADFEQTGAVSAGAANGAKRISLIDLLSKSEAIKDPTDWLLKRLQDDDLWQQVFTRLLPEDCGLTYRDRGIDFRRDTAGDAPVDLGLRAAIDGSSGIAVSLDANTAIEWLALALHASLTLKDITKPDAPTFEFEASLSGNDKAMPKLTASYGQNGFQLAAELPIGGAPEPIRLGLVPFKGIEGFSIEDLWPMLEGAILDNASVKKWLEAPLKQGVAGCTPGSILTAWTLLDKQGDGYRLRRKDGKIDEAGIKALRPEKLIAAALSQFLAAMEELRLVKIGDGNGIYLTRDKAGSRFGVRLTLPDLPLAGGKDDGSPDGRKIALKIGQWMSGETTENWLTRSWEKGGSPPKPGIHIDLLGTKDGKLAFSPGLKLVSVGLDIQSAGKKPLFDIKGYRAEGIELRLYLDASDSGATVGGGVRVSRAAIPLGPKAGADTGSKNPVASGLLSSGEGSSGAGTAGAASDPVNPVFGLQISYVKEFDARILSDGPTANGKVWIPVDKSFGPLYCRKVGLGFDDERRFLAGYDGSVALGPLGIDLLDLTVGIPLRSPQEFSEYTLTLGGLDLSFRGGPVQISGSFLESREPDTPEGVVQYTGAAMIRTETFSIAGLGSYAAIGGAPSMFVFAVLAKDLGGPAFFFVTALAAGFGFKRRLMLPDIEGVQNFPLVRVILEPDYIGKSADPKDALMKLSAAIPPDPSAYWLAAGVRFRSFGLIETVALLSVTFGSEVTISILGLSRLTIPSNIKDGKTPVCYAELALRAEFNPGVGVLSVEARLTSNSYILDKACKLTGGFAFYTWFKGPHEGDFVVTLGGYHPDFIRPAHYPVVPRVGIDWRISDRIRITGELYFALTPSCLMAGGRLSAVYDGGWVRAWFIAYADFLIAWKPFHYDIKIGISLGASATVSLDLGFFSISVTVSFELGVDLHLYGPDFAGTARVSFYIVSFTISFGGEAKKPEALDWAEFSQSFLPEKSAVCGVTFTGGLMQEWKRPDGQSVAVVNGHEFAFSAQSQAPCTEIHWNANQQVQGSDAHAKKLGVTPVYADTQVPGSDAHAKKLGVTPVYADTQVPGSDAYANKLGVSPMYADSLDSNMGVSVKRNDGATLDSKLFSTSLVTKGFPKALWGKDGPELSRPTSDVLAQVPAGVKVELSPEGKESQIRHSLPAMKMELFAYEKIDKKIRWGAVSFPDTISGVTQSIETLSEAIWGNDGVSKKRASVLRALAGATAYPLNDVSLLLTAERAPTIFQSEPRIAALGELLREER